MLPRDADRGLVFAPHRPDVCFRYRFAPLRPRLRAASPRRGRPKGVHIADSILKRFTCTDSVGRNPTADALSRIMTSAPISLSELRRTFADPPAEARPMMRWWWFGPDVTRVDIDRDLEAMAAGGIGGVE